jgi:hypothetical protein
LKKRPFPRESRAQRFQRGNLVKKPLCARFPEKRPLSKFVREIPWERTLCISSQELAPVPDLGHLTRFWTVGQHYLVQGVA